MNKIILIFLLFSANVQAWEVPGNPDRFPSVGFKIMDGHLSGSGISLERVSWFSIPLNDDQEINIERTIIAPSLRLPINSRVTIELNYDYMMEDYSFKGQVSNVNGSVKGGMLGGTFRLYFNR